MARLEIRVGRRTEDLLQFLTSDLSDAELDTVDIQREQEKSDKLATEPFTVAATLTLSTSLVIALGRVIERWIEKQNQLEHLEIVAEGFRISDEAGKGLTRLSEKHATVSIQYRLPTGQLEKKL